MNNPKSQKVWQKFEKLVAAIHRAEMDGATINWNEKINGRQFDVTIRFKTGVYEYLTVVECKNYSTPVKAEKVEALVTKSRDANADKAIMFSASGFQSGAIEVARRHAVMLFSIRDPEEIPEDFLMPETILVNNIFDFSILGVNGEVYVLPEDPMRLRYFAENTIIRHPNGTVTIEQLVRMHQNAVVGIQIGVEVPIDVKFQPPGVVVFPSTENEKSFLVSEVTWKIANREARKLKNDKGLDGSLYEPPYAVKNEIDGSTRYVEKSVLDLGEDVQIHQGKFYKLKNFGYYYCSAVDGDLISFLMIESYQHGRFLQVLFKQEREHARGYVEVSDESVLQRLRWRLTEYIQSGQKIV